MMTPLNIFQYFLLSRVAAPTGHVVTVCILEHRNKYRSYENKCDSIFVFRYMYMISSFEN